MRAPFIYDRESHLAFVLKVLRHERIEQFGAVAALRRVQNGGEEGCFGGGQPREEVPAHELCHRVRELGPILRGKDFRFDCFPRL